MRKRRKLNKILLIAGLVIILAGVVPGVKAYEGHMISITAHVKGEVKGTRSPGWWQTHPEAAEWVLSQIPYDPEDPDQQAGTINMGWPALITNIHEIMGIFWAHQAKNTCDGELTTKRKNYDLCFSKNQASFQVLAAILNSYSPNGAALPIPLLEIRATMSGDDEDKIKELIPILDDFNNSFDDIPLCIPEDYMGEADPNNDEEYLPWIEFANCPEYTCP